MGLEKYNSKRNFKVTSEPKGIQHLSTEELIFVIQEHHASLLHYDFRLEADGVLKSWSVPKGPSMDPKNKRLAVEVEVEVEDHPLEYANFQGKIPEGEYGGGDVKIWDKGIWIPKVDFSKAYQNGKIEFELRGNKLQGLWTLIRLKKSRNWLLMKKKDKFASESSMSNLQQTADMEAASVSSRQTQGLRSKDAKTTPKNLEPQLATLTDEIPEGRNWIFEVKFDGYRTLCRRHKESLELLTRAGKDWTTKYGPLKGEIKKLKSKDFILDGEVVWLDEKGNSSFQGLQTALQEKNFSRLAYYVFDILRLDGEDLTSLPLFERKKRLRIFLKNQKGLKHVLLSEHWENPEKNLMDKICDLGLEGVIAKNADGHYKSGRTEDWLKIKCSSRQEFVIGGYTSSPAQERPRPIGALLMGAFENGKLRYIGKVGTGFSEGALNSLETKLRPLQQSQSPFDLKSPKMKNIRWVKPILIGEVEFKTWTKEGLIRQASFQGLRMDKPSDEVILEAKKPLKSLASEAQVMGVPITHPDRELFPSKGITKIDLARYYEQVMPLMRPFLQDRPVSLMRCPEGATDRCFFQKHGTPGADHQIVEYKDMSNDVMILKNEKSQIEVIQNGAVEFHIWGARLDKIIKPDMLVFDLDPEVESMWPEVVETAINIRELLKEMKLQSFVKLTGGKGVHVQVPIKPTHEWNEVRELTKKMMQAFEKNEPEKYTTVSRKDKRRGRIFLDYLRNGYAATSIAPYSVRSRDSASVALPLSWDELKRVESSSSFPLSEVLKLLKKRKNPWADFFNLSQSLPKAKFK